MSNYEIYPQPGDVPIVTMKGDFTMDDLLVILDEMRQMFDDQLRILPKDKSNENDEQ